MWIDLWSSQMETTETEIKDENQTKKKQAKLREK